MELLKEIYDKDVGTKETCLPKEIHGTRSAARAVLFNKENKIAILHVTKKNYHKLPGGGVEDDEDLFNTLKREVLEETGLIPDDLWLCGTITIDSGENPGIGIFIFRGECEEGTPQASTEGTLAWIPVNQIQTQPLVEDLFTLLPKILSLQPGNAPLSALYAYDENDQLQIRFGA